MLTQTPARRRKRDMMRKLLLSAALLAFFGVLGGSTRHITAETPSGCFPSNLMSYQPGTKFMARSSGSAPVHTTNQVGKLSWQLTETMSNNSTNFGDPQAGTIDGSLNALIIWRDRLTQTRFDSTCMLEVQTNYGYDSEENAIVKEIEMEAQGTVRGLPGSKLGPQAAVASIVAEKIIDTPTTPHDVHTSTPKVRVKFEVELGTQCHENSPAFSIEADGGGVVGSQLHNAGAFELPKGSTIGHCSTES
jgi:hypothetical protein